MIARSLKRRRQGQGMTEYIMLVGLIGLLLITVVTNFKTSIQVTIEGSTGALNRATAAGASVGDTVDETSTGGLSYTKTASTERGTGLEVWTGSDGGNYVLEDGSWRPAR